MKPELPIKIQEHLPEDVVWYISTFVPHFPKPKKTPPCSPSLQRELERLQCSPMRGKNEMYLWGLIDFVLD